MPTLGAGVRIEAMTGAHAGALLAIYQAGIDEGNATFETCPALHRAAGFCVVGTRERIGQHHGRWRDVVLIERRSPVV